jgi:hypothetical protein
MNIFKFSSIRNALTLVIASLGLSAAVGAQAQQKTFAPYEIYYSVFDSTFISAEVAKATGLVRGKDRKLINISVRKQQEDGTTVEHPAEVTGKATDLIHSKNLEFKEIKERGAIYYIAETKIDRNDEMVVFKISVYPEGARYPYKIEFNRRLYLD